MHRVPYICSDIVSVEEQRLIAVLASLEPVFIECGQLARSMQGHVDVERKADSGDARVDVVTRADRAVQQRLLAAMAGTALAGCRLLAEETPLEGEEDLRAGFAAESTFYLTIDPIDGTSRFTQNLPYFSTIIGLHNGRRPLYTFMYYPVFDWWVRVDDRTLTMSSAPPVDVDEDLSRTVVYTVGDPAKTLGHRLQPLREAGCDVRFGEDIGAFGSKYLYLSGHAGGYFGGNPNLYDGVFALHCALARGNVILAEGAEPGSAFDLSDIRFGPRGGFHPGWYLVVPGACATQD